MVWIFGTSASSGCGFRLVVLFGVSGCCVLFFRFVGVLDLRACFVCLLLIATGWYVYDVYDLSLGLWFSVALRC